VSDLNPADKGMILDLLERVKDNDNLFAQELFGELNGREHYLQILIEFGVFHPELLSDKYMYAIDYLYSLLSDEFIKENIEFLIQLIIDTFESTKILKSYKGYYISRVWDIFLRVLSNLKRSEFKKILDSATMPDYLLYKLKDSKELLKESPYSKDLLKYIIISVKLRRIMLEEVRIGETFTKDCILECIFEVLTDETIDYKYSLYKSSLTLRDYDEGSTMIMLASKLLIKYNLYFEFLKLIDVQMILEKIYLLKLIFRIELKTEEFRSIPSKFLENKDIIFEAIKSEYFREEFGIYISRMDILKEDYIKIVEEVYSNDNDKYKKMIKNAYTDLIYGRKSLAELDHILGPSIRITTGFSSTYEDSVSIKTIEKMDYKELNDYYKGESRKEYFSSNNFIEVFNRQINDNNMKFLDNVKLLDTIILNDILDVLSKNKSGIELSNKYLVDIIESASNKKLSINLYRFSEFLETYKDRLSKLDVNTLVSCILSIVEGQFTADISTLRSDEKVTLENISHKFINIRIESLLKIINLLSANGVDVNQIKIKIIGLIKDDKLDNILSYIFGTQILNLYNANPHEITEIYKLLNRTYKIWFFEGYIMHFNLRFVDSKIIQDYILYDLNKAYELNFKNEITISNLSQYYTVIFANDIYNLDFEKIFKNEEFVNGALFTYQNTQKDVVLKRTLDDFIVFISNTNTVYNTTTYERIMFAIEQRGRSEKKCIKIDDKILNALILITKCRIVTFEKSYLGYQFFGFLQAIDHNDSNIEKLCKLLDTALNNRIDCEYLSSYVDYVCENYGKKFKDEILKTIKGNKKADHWYYKIANI